MMDKEYFDLKTLPTDEIARKVAGVGTGSSLELAKFVYNEHIIDRQYMYTRQQIELQHTRNTELLEKQLAKQEDMINTQIKEQSKLMKFSVIVTAIATLSAAIAGAFVAHVLHISEPKEWPQADIQQKIQYKIEPSPIGSSPATNSKPSEKEEVKQKLKK